MSVEKKPFLVVALRKNKFGDEWMDKKQYASEEEMVHRVVNDLLDVCDKGTFNQIEQRVHCMDELEGLKFLFDKGEFQIIKESKDMSLMEIECCHNGKSYMCMCSSITAC